MRSHWIFAGLLAPLLGACAPADVTLPTTEAHEEPAVPQLMTWDDLNALPRPSGAETIQWGAGATDVADLWLPSGPGPHPVAIMVHGGCWQKSIADRTLMDWMASSLAQEGWAVWNIEYRGVDEEGGGYPGTFLDVSAAADALRGQAHTHDLDLSRVTGIGHSAGGHLILWLAARRQLQEGNLLKPTDPIAIRGVVVSGGLADLEASRPVTLPSCLDAVYDQLIGPATSERPDPLADVSPARLLPVGVPFVSVHGDSDRIAPPVLAEQLAEKARAVGDEAGVIIVPETGHVELVTPGTEAFRQQAAALKALIEAD